MPTQEPEDKPLTPSQQKAIEKLRKRWDYQSLDSISEAFTAGCSLGIKVAEFDSAHYEQEDISLNKTLWDLWPTDPNKLDGYIKQHQEKADRLFKSRRETWADDVEPTFDLEQLRVAMPSAERARIGSNLRLMHELHVRLHTTGLLPFNVLSEGVSPLTLLMTRKSMFDVPSLSAAVEAGKRLKAQADAINDAIPSREDGEERTPAQSEAKHTASIEALGTYCSALMGLWPWTASGLIMTPEVAFDSGLAQLEAQLWKDISNTVIALSDYSGSESRPRSKNVEGHYFRVLARACNLVPLLTRYCPLDTYWECHRDMMMLALFMPKELNYSYEVTAGLEVGLLSMMYGGNDSWAHARCDERHLTCTFEGAIKAGMRTRSLSESIPEKQGAKIEPISDSDDAASGSGSDSKSDDNKVDKTKGKKKSKKENNGDDEKDKGNEEEEIKYYNKRGKVVGSGPRQPMRFTGVVQPPHQTSKPSTAFPCD